MRQEKASRLYVTDIKQKLFLFDSVGFRNTTKLLVVYHKYDKPAFDDLFQLLKYGYVFDVDVLNIIEISHPHNDLPIRGVVASPGSLRWLALYPTN